MRLLREKIESKIKIPTDELLSVVKRMKSDLESWEETLEIMRNKELMASIKRSREDVKKGRVLTFKSVSELKKRYK